MLNYWIIYVSLPMIQIDIWRHAMKENKIVIAIYKKKVCMRAFRLIKLKYFAFISLSENDDVKRFIHSDVIL